MRRPAARALTLGMIIAATAFAGCSGADRSEGVRLGYFPNITHAQALYGIQTGLFAKAIGAENFTSTTFNAGPTAIEALLTHQIDATYVGPGPVLNAWSKSWDVVRIIAGAASGGARFIVQPDVNLDHDTDLAGKTFASPQLGNTQDLSLKAYLRSRGHSTNDRGGDVQVINAANPDILAFFVQHQIDGAWVPEPWATRLERDGGGRELLDERTLWPDGQFTSTVLVTTKDFLERHPDRVRHLLEAHIEATQAVQTGGANVLQAIDAGIAKATGKGLGQALLAGAIKHLNFTVDPLAPSILAFGQKARDLDLLTGTSPPINQVVTLGPLNELLARQGRAGVPQP